MNSPQVATYDLQPEMSAQQVLAAVLDAVNSRSHDLIIVNFANPDMVGHTGDLSAAVTAVETVDKAVGQIAKAVTAAKGALLLTADHGNCEVMWDTAAIRHIQPIQPIWFPVFCFTHTGCGGAEVAGWQSG